MKIKNLIRLLSLAVVSVGILSFTPGDKTKKKNMNQVNVSDSIIQNIMTRTSVRTYQQRAVEPEKIEILLRAGMAAPSAVNRQPWHFVVVTDKAQLKALGGNGGPSRPVADAPLGIVVCGDMNKAMEGDGREYWVQDASAVTENILLAANGLGLGAVWLGVYPMKERCKTVSGILHLPKNLVPLNIISIGYPKDMPTPKDKFKRENISYNFFGGKQGDAVPAPVAEDDDFREFKVHEDFKVNPFTVFRGPGWLLCAGDKEKSNAMTIGWGGLGTLWGQDLVSVYVAQTRYTKQFMDKAKYFTIMQFDPEDNDILEYMGSNSGRDKDKAKELDLHLSYTEHGTPYYNEARVVIECEILYDEDFQKANMKELPAQFYSHFPAGVHKQYIGRVVKALKR